MSVEKVLIVGGGFTGLTAAIALAQRGVSVTLVDRAPAWARVGHGLTIQGNALRVFRELGVIDEILEKGQAEHHVTLYFADGRVMAELPTPRTGGDDLPATIGALRPDLHEILVNRAESLGVEIRLGLELTSYESRADSATSVLSDGTPETWGARVIADSPERMSGVVIPNAALVVYASQSWCYVETEPKKYERKLVSLEAPVDDGFFVKSGFDPGTRVVVKGASVLLSREAEPGGFDDDDDDAGPRTPPPSAERGGAEKHAAPSLAQGHTAPAPD